MRGTVDSPIAPAPKSWKLPRTTSRCSRRGGSLLGFSLRAYDEEKRKTAHAIHDSAGQYLIALQMKLDGLQRGEWRRQKSVRG